MNKEIILNRKETKNMSAYLFLVTWVLIFILGVIAFCFEEPNTPLALFVGLLACTLNGAFMGFCMIIPKEVQK